MQNVVHLKQLKVRTDDVYESVVKLLYETYASEARQEPNAFKLENYERFDRSELAGTLLDEN